MPKALDFIDFLMVESIKEVQHKDSSKDESSFFAEGKNGAGVGFEPHDLLPFEHASRSTKGGYSPCSHNARATANVIIAKRDPYRHHVAVYCQLGATKPHLAQTLQSLKSTIPSGK